MLYAPIAPRRVDKAVGACPAVAEPLTPSGYIRLRREATGLSQRDVAARLSVLALRNFWPHPADRQFSSVDQALDLIVQMEKPGVRARHRATIAALAAVMPLDVDVYRQLALDPPDRHPTICRGCGCSAHDTCGGEDGICSLSLSGTCSRCNDRPEAQ